MLWHPKHKVHFIGVLLRGTDQEIKILTKASVQSQGHMMLLGSGAGISKACEPLVIISLDLIHIRPGRDKVAKVCSCSKMFTKRKFELHSKAPSPCLRNFVITVEMSDKST